MANEILKRDQNFVVVLGGITDDAAQEVRMFRVDPTTGRLIVSMTGIAVSATVDVGTTTTGAPGTDASVVNSGTTTAAVFDFTIPRGDKGDQGDPGAPGPVGITWQGTYNAGTAYVINDGVTYLGTSYICIQNGTGQTPDPTGTAYWEVLALKGTNGAGSGDVIGPATNTDSYIPQWDGANSKTLKNGLAVPSGGLAGLTAPTFATSITGSYLTASEILITDGSKNIVSAPVATYPSLTELSYVKGLSSAIQTQLNGKQATLTNPVTGTGTINELAYWASGSTIGTLAVATYPSLTELSYVKGLTSAIQTQLNAKAPSASPSFTGTITLADNARIDLTLPTADTYCTGNTTDSFAAGYSTAVGDLVFLGSAGKWLEVDADAVATCKGLIGIALEAKADTQAMKVALPGSMVRLDAWNWTVGATLYAGETLGLPQEAIPTGADAIIKVIGFAVSADVIFFNPSPDQQSTVA